MIEEKQDNSDVPLGMRRIYFSTSYRAFRAGVIIAPVSATAGFLVSYHPNQVDTLLGALLVALCGLLGGYKAWQKRFVVGPCVDIYVIPATEKKQRVRESFAWTIMALAVVGMVVYSNSSNVAQDGAIFSGLILLFETCYVASVMFRHQRTVPPGKVDILGPWKSSLPKAKLGKGYPRVYRYSAAGCLIYLAYQLGAAPNEGGTAAVLLLIAVGMMYEIIVGVVICALAYWFFGAVATIPTSVAVLIGAYWIAESNKKKG